MSSCSSSSLPRSRFSHRGFTKGLSVVTFLAIFICLISIIKPLVHQSHSNTGTTSTIKSFSSRSLHQSSDHPSSPHIECEDIGSQLNKCEFVREYCDDVNALIPYLEFRYCTMTDPGLPGLAYLILFCCLLLCISLLATTAEYFFVPSLQFLSDQLNLSPAVAGITLLALGNGAPDIFTAIAGLQADDFPLVLGGLVGASMFIATVVLGSVLLAAPNDSVRVDKTSFIRDVSVYIIATAVIIGIALSHSVALWQAMLFIILYVLYVLIVVVHSRIRKAKRRGPTYRASLLPSEAFNNSDDIIDDSTNGVSLNRVGGITEFMSIPADADEAKQHNMNSPINNNSNNMNELESPNTIDSSIRELLHELETEEQQEEENNPNFIVGISWPSDPAIIGRIQYFIELPFSCLRWLTSPPADGKWSSTRRFLWIIHPFMFMCILLLAAKGWAGFSNTYIGNSSMPLIALLLPIAAIISLFVYCLSTDIRTPPFYSFFSVISFVSAIAWLNLIASETVSILQTFGLMLDISTSLLGLTVLAVGNSVGDWVADVAVARAGSPATSIAACFGSPLLNDVGGLGISLTITTAKIYPQLFEFQLTDQLYVGWAFLCTGLIASALVFPAFNYRPPRIFAWSLIGLYLLFVFFSVLVEVGAFN